MIKTPVAFSQATIDRARKLSSLVSFLPHRYSSVLAAIQMSGVIAHTLEQLLKVGVRDADSETKMRLTEENYQATLQQFGITDDASANQFLDQIEPQLQDWGQQHRQLPNGRVGEG